MFFQIPFFALYFAFHGALFRFSLIVPSPARPIRGLHPLALPLDCTARCTLVPTDEAPVTASRLQRPGQRAERNWVAFWSKLLCGVQTGQSVSVFHYTHMVLVNLYIRLLNAAHLPFQFFLPFSSHPRFQFSAEKRLEGLLLLAQCQLVAKQTRPVPDDSHGSTWNVGTLLDNTWWWYGNGSKPCSPGEHQNSW